MAENRGRSIKGTRTKHTWTKPKAVGSRVGGRNGSRVGDHGGVKMETSVLEKQ